MLYFKKILIQLKLIFHIFSFFLFSRENQIGCGLKRKNSEVSHIGGKLSKPSTSNVTEMVNCEICNVSVKKRYLNNHLNSNTHKNKQMWTTHSVKNNVQIIENAFGKRVMTCRIYPPNNANSTEFNSPERFFSVISNDILELITDLTQTLKCIKINFILKANFTQETKNLTNQFDFQTMNQVVTAGSDLDQIINSLSVVLLNRISEFEQKDSGWALDSICHIDMNVNKFNPLRGSSYIDLPRDIKYKKAIINVKNNDCLCFKWALLSALYPSKKNSDRVTSYTIHAHKLNFENIAFPIKLRDISKIERVNDISINVFTLEYDSMKKKNSVVGPIHFTKQRKDVHVNLLYISNGTVGHYCYIKNLSRLVSAQISLSNDAIHICDGCLLYFSTKHQLNRHQQNDCAHVRIDLPMTNNLKNNWFGEKVSNSILKFDNFERKYKLPFVIYADFEAFLKPIPPCNSNVNVSNTTNVAEHEVYSFGYYIKCSFSDKLSKYQSYTGPDCAKVFMKHLYSDLVDIYKVLNFQKRPFGLTTDDKIVITESNQCYICGRIINEKEKHNDYDWYTGLFRGVSHEKCGQKFRVLNFIPIYFHNLSHYDAHFIIKALDFEDGDVDLIPQNKERYISFSKTLKINNRYVKLRFLDSYKFMTSSLDSLARILKDSQFKELKKTFNNVEDFKLLKRKGVYPYEYMTSYNSLSLTSLPEKQKFYSSLSDTSISDEDYQHALTVWNHFKCKSMSDYSDLYLKTDVLLLTDIFENFRDICIKNYELDPTHYYTAPGLSWDAMLKHTGISLDLFTDFDKISFIKSGIRGGVVHCSNRYARANNKYMLDYDSSHPDTYLEYLDANNLYGWAMSQYLPTGNFEWVHNDINFNISTSSDYGYILEVDLEYPDTLHDLHSDLPLCPEKISINNTKETKLVSNLNNKKKYIIHYRNLQQCLELGMKLSKIHRVLKFKQSPWLAKYIELNTNLRTVAESQFEKDFFKLMNNAVFGKTMENIEKRVNVKILTHWENHGKRKGAQDYISKPEFHSLSIFSENVVAIQLNRLKLFYNKPIYLGFCILDLSKTLMFDFHYNYMCKKFPNNLKLLYTDTDSLIYQIFTDDFYRDIKVDLERYFDTSDYETNNKFGYSKINKKKIGYFKDECNGKILREFVGLRAKMYAIDVENSITCKAKGINKCVTKKMLIENYKSCLFEKSIHFSEMYRFKSIKHTIFTQKIYKKCLSYDDSKRYILPNSTDTLAWGHYKIKK